MSQNPNNILIDKIKDIVDSKLPENDKNSKLDKIANGDSAKLFTKYIQIARDCINNPRDPDLQKQFEEERNKLREKLNDLAADISEQVNREVTINELVKETGLSVAEINEILNGLKTPDDVSSPEEKKKIEKVKKLYTYKVEGEIKSGIEDLDRFLAIIKPALDQVIIAPWRVIYGMGDAGQWCFDHYKAHREKKKNMSNAWKTLQRFGLKNSDEKFKYSKSNKKNEKEITELFEQRWLEKLNGKVKDKGLKEIKEKYREKAIEEISNDPKNKGKTKEELASLIEQKTEKNFKDFTKTSEYKNFMNSQPKTKMFDERDDPTLAREVIIEDLLGLYGDLRDPKTGKISDDDMKIIGGFANAVDLFNKKNSSEFADNFSRYIGYIFQEDKKGYKGYNVEDKSVENWIGNADSYYEKLAGRTNLEELFKQYGASK